MHDGMRHQVAVLAVATKGARRRTGRPGWSPTLSRRLASLALSAVLGASLAATAQAPVVLSASVSYRLPWAGGESHKAVQGWERADNYSHTAGSKMEFAYDFDLAEGTPVRAAAEGIVAAGTRGDIAPDFCGTDREVYANQGNRVVIDHTADGTSTLYLHLQRVDVSPGQKVTAGQVIGLAGKTGWTGCNPHLHFQRQSPGSWFEQSQEIHFVEYPGQELPAGVPLFSQNQSETGGACTTAWSEPVDGRWSDATRWTDGVPDGTKQACIGLAGSYTVTVDSPSAALRLIVGAAGMGTSPTLDLRSTLDTTAGLANHGTVLLNANGTTPYLHSAAGTLFNAGTVRKVGTSLARIAGGLHNSGLLRVAGLGAVGATAPGASANVEGLEVVQSATGGSLQITDGVTNVGTVTVDADTSIGSGAWYQAAGNLEAHGELIVSSSGFTMGGGTITGTPMTISSGFLDFGPATTGSAKFLMPSGGEIRSDVPAGIEIVVGRGSLLLPGDGFTNAGTIRTTAESGTITLDTGGGPLRNSGTITRDGFYSTIVKAGSITNKGTINATTTTGYPYRLGLVAPVIDNQGTIDLARGADFSGGTSGTPLQLTNSGTLHVSATREARVFLAGGSFTQAGGTLAIDGDLLVDAGTLRVEGGAITGNPVQIQGGGALSAAAGAPAPAASIEFTGLPARIETDLPAGFVVMVTDSPGTLTLGNGGGFTNAGTIRTVPGTGSVTLDTSGGPLRNSGTITRDGFYSTIVKAGSITNKGTINATTTTGYPYRLGLVAPVIDNQGTIDLARGADFSGGTSGTPLQLTNSGTLHVSATREARVFLAGGSFTQAGGTLAIDGDLLVDAGTLRVEGGAITGNPVQIQGGGALSAAAGAPAPAASIEFTGLPARIETDLPAGFVVMVTDSPGTLTLGNGGGFTNAGTIRTVPGTGSVTLDTSGGPLRNSGTITRAGFYSTSIRAGSITNTGTINATPTTGYPYPLWLAAPVIDNRGTIDLARGGSFGEGTTTGRVSQLTNSGTIHVPADRDATAYLAGTFTQTAGTLALDGDLVVDGGTVRVEGGAITGTGTLDGDLYNAGTVAPGDSPGILTVTGDYVQAPAGTLSVEIASLDPGDIDLLRVGGAAQIAGILKVQASGYVPVLDDLVTLIEAGAVSGSFSTIDGAAVGTGLGFVPEPTATAYRLRVVAGVAVTPFTDIAGSPFKPDIEWVYTAGITSGCTATAYCPDGYVTREQMASLPRPCPQAHRHRPRRLHRRRGQSPRAQHQPGREGRHRHRLCCHQVLSGRPRVPGADGLVPRPGPQARRHRPRRLHRRRGKHPRAQHQPRRESRGGHRLRSRQVLPHGQRHPGPDGRLPPPGLRAVGGERGRRRNGPRSPAGPADGPAERRIRFPGGPPAPPGPCEARRESGGAEVIARCDTRPCHDPRPLAEPTSQCRGEVTAM